MNPCDTLEMWSSQTDPVWEILERDGVTTVKREYIRRKYGEAAWIFETAYRYFTERFRQVAAPPDGAESPVWLFADPLWAFGGPGAEVRKLRIPRTEVLLFDRRKWNRVLNLSYVGTPEETERFEMEMRRQGIWDSSELFEKPVSLFLKRKVIRSWDSMWDVGGLPEADIQGAAWCLRREWLTGE